MGRDLKHEDGSQTWGQISNMRTDLKLGDRSQTWVLGTDLKNGDKSQTWGRILNSGTEIKPQGLFSDIIDSFRTRERDLLITRILTLR